MNIFDVTITWKDEIYDDHESKIKVYIAGEDEDEVKKLLYDNPSFAEGLFQSDFVIKGAALLKKIEQVHFDRTKEALFFIPLDGEYEYRGKGLLQDALLQLTDHDDRSMPSKRVLVFDDLVVHYYFPQDESARSAIEDCIKQGIDPFGY